MQIDLLQILISTVFNISQLTEYSSLLERHQFDVTDPLEGFEQIIVCQEVRAYEGLCIVS